MEDALGDRMKRNYENRNRTYLTRGVPVIIRVDGQAFHTLTRSRFDKPFDVHLMRWMIDAAKRLAKDIGGFKLGYVQSDEASFLVTDYDTVNTQAWFDYSAQKVASIPAARVTGYFNQLACSSPIGIQKMGDRIASFDGRCFNIPEGEIANYFLWRARDWKRNSLSMLTRAHFSHKEVAGKTGSDMHEMLRTRGVNWAKLPDAAKNGTFLFRVERSPRRFEIGESADTLPKYELINDLVRSVLAPREKPQEEVASAG